MLDCGFICSTLFTFVNSIIKNMPADLCFVIKHLLYLVDVNEMVGSSRVLSNTIRGTPQIYVCISGEIV